MTPRVAVIGDALIDVIDDRHVPGGAALNVAVGLAKLGLSVDLISMLADDAPGAVLRAYAEGHGVRVHATRAPFGTATATATLRADSMDYVFNEAGRKRFVAVNDAQQVVLAADCVVASCVALENARQCQEIESALAPSRPFVLDANPRDGYLWSPDAVSAFGEGLLRLAPEASLLKLSDEDAQLLYDTDPETAAAGMLESGLAAALITEGPRGAKIVTANGTVSRPIAHLNGDIVDTIGAGDATTAAMTAAMLQGEDWGTALERAMLLAAATCRGVGGELRLP
ncbi:MAG TPA: hypothetical protein H9830_07490 [Candidatus Agrococcus pullicola]|uniref:Carbohydrate kinase PfkB domain-containing protein n=1 Tax=Candidatus Agrococcus pullicola TaxID=2838429 RepID=A0A9D1YUL0_9MICO|nr:hypothetical protein [Candidatus Agrococcus pullicola]